MTPKERKAESDGHADDCEMMTRLLTGWRCTCGYDPDVYGIDEDTLMHQEDAS